MQRGFVSRMEVVKAEFAGKRLYRYSQLTFANDLPSKSHCRRAILAGELRVNGAVAEDTRILKEGDTVRLDHCPGKARLATLIQKGLRIRLQEPEWLVVWKPAGIGARPVEDALDHLLMVSGTEPGLMLYSLEKAASGLCIFLAPRLVPAMLQRYSKDMLHLTFRLICQGSIYNRLGDPSLLVSEPFRVAGSHSRAEETHTGGITSPLHPSRLHIVQVTRSPGTKERYITTLDARVPPSRPGESLGVQPSLGKELREHLYNKGLPVIGNGAFTQTLRASRDKGLFMSLLSISFPHPVELTESQDDPSSSQQPSLINVTYPEPIKFGSLRDREETFYARQHQRDEEELRRGGKLCPAQEGQDPTLAGPIAYLVGTKEFYGLRFHVTRDTLIPRVSTERLVHTTLSLLSSRTSSLPSTILDVGTGTGCILLSILKHSSATGRGVDISAEALEVAVRNAKELGLEDRVTFQRGDLYRLEENHLRSQGQQPYTIIVCNPPYLRPSKTLALVSQSGEPEIALMAGSTGLEAYRGLLSSLTRCPELLAPLEGRVVLEVGQGMHKSVEAIWCGPGKEWEVESRVRDQQQWIRCLVLRRVIAQTTRCNEDGNDHIL